MNIANVQHGFYRLTEDVQNPHADGRKANTSFKKKRVWKAGTIFEVTVVDSDIHPSLREVNVWSIRADRQNIGHINAHNVEGRDQVEALLGKAESHKSVETFMEHANNTAIQLLQKLVDTGTVTYELLAEIDK